MGDSIYYNEEILGRVHVYCDEKNPEYQIVMDGLENLKKLCNLEDKEVLELGDLIMNFREFKEKIISKTTRIYIDGEVWASDHFTSHQ